MNNKRILSPATFHKKRQNNIPLVLAHRGASNIVPENTLESFAIAIAQEADFVEMDVIYTKDRKQIIFHEPCLGKITDVHKFPEFASRTDSRYMDYEFKNVTDTYADLLTLEEIKMLSVNQQQGPSIAGRPRVFDSMFSIPTLEETIELFLQLNQEKKQKYEKEDINVKKLTGINLEIKDAQMYREVFGEDFNHGEEVLKTLKKYGLDDYKYSQENLPILISSFDQRTVKYMKQQTLLPCFQLTSHVYPYSLEEIAEYADGICCDLNYVVDKKTYKSTGYIEKAHLLGLQVFGFTVRDDQLIFTNNYLAIYDLLQNIVHIDGILSEFTEKAKAVFYAFEIKNMQLNFEELNQVKDEEDLFIKKRVKKNATTSNFNALTASKLIAQTIN